MKTEEVITIKNCLQEAVVSIDKWIDNLKIVQESEVNLPKMTHED